MLVFISKENLHVSVYSGHLQVQAIFCKIVLYNTPKPRGDFEISSTFCVLLLS